MSNLATYDLGLKAVIDLDADPAFAGLTDELKQRMINRLTYKMALYGDEFFGDAGHHIERPADDDDEQTTLDLVMAFNRVLFDGEGEAS